MHVGRQDKVLLYKLVSHEQKSPVLNIFSLLMPKKKIRSQSPVEVVENSGKNEAAGCDIPTRESMLDHVYW